MSEPGAGAASWRLPGAIVVGCALVGIGLFFGLRRPAPEGARSSPSAGSSPSTSPGPSAVAPDASTPDAAKDPELALRAAEQARVALEKHRTTMIDKCWRPLTADGGPKQALFDFVYDLDANGKQTKREVRATAGQPGYPEIARCLEGLPATEIAVPAPSAMPSVTIQVPFP